MNELTEKQKRFCEEYIIDLNATQAAIRAGYSEKTAMEQGYQLLHKTSVVDFIQKLMSERSKRTQITADKVIKELAKIGFSNISDYLKIEEKEIEIGFDEEEKPIYRTITDVEIFPTDHVGRRKMSSVCEIKKTRDGISIKLHDKVKALEDIGKHLGIFEKDNRQKTQDFGVIINKIVTKDVTGND